MNGEKSWPTYKPYRLDVCVCVYVCMHFMLAFFFFFRRPSSRCFLHYLEKKRSIAALSDLFSFHFVKEIFCLCVCVCVCVCGHLFVLTGSSHVAFITDVIVRRQGGERLTRTHQCMFRASSHRPLHQNYFLCGSPEKQTHQDVLR